MSKKRNQHYVPQFYLRNFSLDERSISLFNLKSRKIVIGAPIKGQCYKKFLYGRDQVIEDALTKLEGLTSIVFKKIVDSKTPPTPYSSDHVTLMTYIVSQLGRTISAGEELDEMTDNLAKHILRPQLSQKGIEPKDLDRIHIGYKDPVRRSLAYYIWLYPLLLDLRFVVLVNETSEGFITSDSPVVLYNQYLEERRFSGNTGLQSVGLQMIFPLSPKFALFFFDSAVYGIGRDNSVSISISDVIDIRSINLTQYVSTIDNIYFCPLGSGCEELIKQQHAISLSFMRDHRSNLRTQEMRPTRPNSRRELVVTFREDIRTRMALSFTKIKTKAKKNKQDAISRLKIRDPVIVNLHKEFRGLVKRGLYRHSEFPLYLNRNRARYQRN